MATPIDVINPDDISVGDKGTRSPCHANMDFRKPNPGAVLKNGKLFLFCEASIVVVSMFPVVRAWEKSARRPFWRGVNPANLKDFWPVSLSCKSKSGWVLNRFVAQAPQSVKETVLSFPSPYRFGLLALISRAQSSMDVVLANPALAFCLSQSHLFLQMRPARTWDVARRLLQRRQRDALEPLGFPPAESAARILRKIPCHAVSIRRAYTLQKALWDKKMHQRLCHVQVLSAPVLEVLTIAPSWDAISSRLLNELGEIRDPAEASDAAHMIRQLMGTGTAMVQGLAPLRLLPASLRQLKRAYFERVLLAVPRPPVAPDLPLDVLFPEPPFPVPRYTQRDIHLEPIRTVKELLAESYEMRHCIATYARDIVAGECCAFRVLAPERGTLTLVPYAPSHWVVGDLRGVKNHVLRRSTLLAVAAYLNSRQDRMIPLEEKDDDDVPF